MTTKAPKAPKAPNAPQSTNPTIATITLPSANSSVESFVVGALNEKQLTLFTKCSVNFANARKTRCLLNKALHTVSSQSNFAKYAEKAISDEILHILTLAQIALVFNANTDKCNQRVYTTIENRNVTVSDCRNRIFGNGETAENAKAVSAFANA